MRRSERLRDAMPVPPTTTYFQERTEAGWKLAAIEWEREVEADIPDDASAVDVPFGLRIASDCNHLEENPTEKRALMLMMELIVQESPFSRIAGELNRQGFRTRSGTEWTEVSVYNLLPRLIESGPRLFSSAEWITHLQQARRASAVR
jgi:hypothetical protein